MNLPVHLGGLLPFPALAAVPMFAGDGNGDSGTRTLIGALITLVVIGIVVSIGLFMGRGERA